MKDRNDHFYNIPYSFEKLSIYDVSVFIS